jgi:2-polyprenyl-6-hydroxyphenyl methylase/3-demethylubiquinone-9 3-methyltransferase
MTSKIDAEVEKFDNLAHNWWNANDGEFRLLHQINPLRIEFILKHIQRHFKITANQNAPLTGLRVLDIGCGGGLASIPMARLGASVTGIDPSINAVASANLKAASLGLPNVEHVCLRLEDFQASDEFKNKFKGKFDVVLCLDVLEHASDLSFTIDCIAKFLKPSGAVIISTINKTPKAFFQAIIMAEYVLQMLPRATHDYAKLIKPSVLQNEFSKHGLSIKQMGGITFSLLKQQWELSKSISINYLAYIN